jgi:hypothetical protein
MPFKMVRGMEALDPSSGSDHLATLIRSSLPVVCFVRLAIHL